MKKLLLFMVLLLMGLASRAQTDTDKISVSGHVLDSKGDNIPGATVLERGTTNGTATNSEGRFIIKVSPNSTLTFSAIGFVPQQVPVQGRTNIEVKLEVSSTDLSEIVVTGSRATEGRSNILTTSPVDVISPREIKAYAQTDVTQILTYVAPSFQSSRQTISDGTDHIDPASLRGLGPDQTLVLVNGKRRHSTALVNINGTVGRGSVGTDMNVIPPAAIKRIEVLRDGAAAQYGSDAIAGVINIQLKDDSSGVLATSTLGRHYEGDGELLQADANVGIGLGSRGFVNVSGQFSNRSFTNRSGEDTAPLIYLGDNGGNYPTVNTSNQPLTFQGGSNGTSNISFYSPGAAGAAITPSNPNSPTFTQADIDRASANRAALKAQDDELAAQRGYNRRNLRWGNSIQRNFGGFINAGFQLSRNLGLDAYLTAGLSRREGRASGFNRLPSAISPQIDLTLYPDGFLPFIEPSIEDRSILGGLRGTVLGFNWDLSSVYGSNSLEFGVEGSLNASLPLGTSPRSFEAGKIFFSQNTNNLSFVRKFRELGPLATLNLAFGGEYRVDNYEISAGEFSSYGFGTNGNNGRNVLPQNGTRIPVPTAAGAQVFPGFQPQDATERRRTNAAGYVDIETDLNERVLVSIAGRAEDYSDFGSAISGKFATRVSILNNLNVRGAVSNGFRAPSLQQRYFTNVSTQFVNGEPRQVLTVNNDNPIVRNSLDDATAPGFGVPSLKQEKSINLSTGLTARLGTITITADAYQIDIDDRIVLSTQFAKSTTVPNPPVLVVDRILNSQPGIGSVQFFANAIDTRTRGVDVVMNDRLIFGKHRLNLTAAANFTETKVRGVRSSSTIDADPTLQNSLFDRQQRNRIENAQPNSKINLSASYNFGRLGLELRTVRFGEVVYKDARPDNAAANGGFLFSSIDQTFDAKWVTDASVSIQMIKLLTLTVGANNLFDVYPDQYRINPRNNPNNTSADPALSYLSNRDNTNRGRSIYNPNQFGFNGGFYFARLSFQVQ